MSDGASLIPRKLSSSVKVSTGRLHFLSSSSSSLSHALMFDGEDGEKDLLIWSLFDYRSPQCEAHIMHPLSLCSWFHNWDTITEPQELILPVVTACANATVLKFVLLPLIRTL